MSDKRSQDNVIVRRAKACNTCRRKKTKCDGKRPICSSCNTFGFSCGFQDVLKHGNRSSQEYIQELEKRLQGMERQLHEQNVTISNDRLEANTGPSMRSTSMSPHTRDSDWKSESSHLDDPPFDGPEAEKDESRSTSGSESGQASYILNSHDGKMRFFGPSSGFSVISSQGSTLLESKSRTERPPYTLQRSINRPQLGNWIPRVLQDEPSRRVFQPLPSKQTTVQLVGEFFSTFNKAIPLFNEPLFMRLIEKHFSWNPNESPSWWASFNVVLAFAYRERAQHSPDGSEDWTKSLGYIKNALNVVVDLLLRNSDLLAAQGMLGLALFFQDTPNPQPLFMFAAAAMRLSQSIGLHSSNTFGMSAPDLEERRRTFWIAFILDADISHRTGRPPVQDTNDYDTPLPSDSPYDGLGVIALNGIQINYFYLLARFSLVQRHVYRQLYSATAVSQSGPEMIKRVRACEDALLEWRSLVPKECQPQRVFSADHHLLSHVLRLHFAYHTCYANLHWKCLLARRLIKQSSQSTDDFPSWEKELEQSLARSHESARSSMELIKQVDKFGISFAWSILYFPAAASATLLSQILANPHHEHARTDLCTVRQTIQFISTLSLQEPGTYAEWLLSVCSDLERAASQALDHAERDGSRASALERPVGDTSAPSAPARPPNLDLRRTSLTNHTDLLGSDPAERMDLEFPLSPFLNWQDMTFGMPPTFDFGNGNGQFL